MTNDTKKQPPFKSGQILATAGVADEMNGMDEDSIAFKIFVSESLGKHLSGNWGELDAKDIEVNNDALEHGGRLFSAYIPKQYPQLDNDEYKIYIVTEADRRSSTILFPREY